MSRNLEDIAWDATEALYYENPAISDDGKANFFVAGSMATLALINADEIQDMFIDEDGNFIGYGDTHNISSDAKNVLKKFRRKIHDIDVISYDDSNYGNKRELIKVTDMSELCNSRFALPIEYEQAPINKTQTFLCKAKKDGKEIIVPSPLDMATQKLVQCIKRYIQIIKYNKELDESVDNNKEKIFKRLEKIKNDYNKKTKDLLILLEFTKLVYPLEMIVSRISERINIEEFDNNIVMSVLESINNSDLISKSQVIDL